MINFFLSSFIIFFCSFLVWLRLIGLLLILLKVSLSLFLAIMLSMIVVGLL